MTGGGYSNGKSKLVLNIPLKDRRGGKGIFIIF
jgi:hypothetical protein